MSAAPKCPPKVVAAVDGAIEAAYLIGLNDGLRVAETIRGWLTRQPDTTRQAEVRQWADAAIERARKEFGS